MKPGEPFNPWGTVNPRIAIMRRKNLTDGAKLAWCRLEVFAGKSGVCNPSMPRLAVELARSDPRRARSAVAELEKHGLIRRRVGGGAETNSFEFLWQAEFEAVQFPLEPRTQLSGVDPGRRSPVRTQTVVDPGRRSPPNVSVNLSRRVASQKTRRAPAKKREKNPFQPYQQWLLIQREQAIPPLPPGEHPPKSELNNAKRMLAGVPDEDITGAVRMMRENPFWGDKEIRVHHVKNQLGAYRRRKAGTDSAAAPAAKYHQDWQGDPV